MVDSINVIQQDFNLEVPGYWIVESYKICKSVLRNYFLNSLAAYLVFHNFHRFKNMIFTLVFWRQDTKVTKNQAINWIVVAKVFKRVKISREGAIQGVMVTRNQTM